MSSTPHRKSKRHGPLPDSAAEPLEFFGLYGHAHAFLRLVSELKLFSQSKFAVLLTGETGTGKSHAARALHQAGPRQNEPFISVNCGGLVGGLFESELFGHARGSFTGADGDRIGLFQQAAGGTLFLDELGELPLDKQPALLHALDGRIRRVGGRELRTPDVRIISATNRNLEEMVRAGSFRKDLYFPLTTLGVQMPALADRTADLPLLWHSVCVSRDLHLSLCHCALDAMEAHPWEGNMRELQHAVSRASLFATDLVCASHLRLGGPASTSSTRRRNGRRVSAADISEALDEHHGVKTRAARSLGISRQHLYRLLAEFDIG